MGDTGNGADGALPIETWHYRPSWKLSGYSGGGIFICEDGADGSLPQLKGGFLGLDLREGTTAEEATEVLRVLTPDGALH